MLKKQLRRRLGRYAPFILVILAIVLVSVIIYAAYGAVSAKPQAEVKEFKEHRLVAIPAKGIAGGVLAGFAYYFSIPLWLVRILFVPAIAFLADGFDFLVLAYILLWVFMPSIDFIPADFLLRTG